ncbi:MAG: cysteine hydrolase [Bacteroidetes bacterium]|nr:cysteine hydrolase [Microbacteriaceae bacterium]NBS60746.1 cysteine hydrolase [Microbacteriaceae bacterium]NBT46878.1 cysteine hydrolase [Actinomycetota bacterium]NBU70342.1 cysteine hydrolase [Bacteroidota bacterium]
MTTISGRDKTALLVIDVQNGVVEGAYNLSTVLENINLAVAKARASNVPIIWVQHSEEEMPIGSDQWQIVSDLSPAEEDYKVGKTFPSSFESTNLEEILENLNVAHLVISGMQTNNCVRHTSHAAQERGYDVTVLGDAHSTTGYTWAGHTVLADVIVNEFNDNFGHLDLPGRANRAIKTADLSF